MRGKSRLFSVVLILAIMIFCLISNKTVSAATESNSIGSLHVATYQNTVPTLPKQIGEINVTWPDLDAKQFSELFSVVSVTGTKADGSNVTASIEVIPENLVYFIDCGTGTEWDTIMNGSQDAGAARNLISLPFMAVKALVGDALLNEVSDQYYDETRTWGIGYTKANSSSDRSDPIQSYWNNNIAPEDNSEISNKFAAGLRASNNTNFEYYLTLEAGTYTLTTGFHEFYDNNHNRGMVPKIYNNADGKLITAFDTVTMTNNGSSSLAPDIVASGSFSLSQKTMVKVHYEKASGENGSMNWLAVHKENGTYDTIPGTSGDVILSSNTGIPMQAHGGSASAMKEGTSEGCINFDLDGDGQITEGKLVYLWYGENKTNNTRPVDGVRCYTSTDLYNWRDMGNVLYLQNAILPIEISDERAVTSERGASGIGTTQSYNTLQFSEKNYETLKLWGKMETAPNGVSEDVFNNVKLFLRAYVTKFDKEPTSINDTAWTAKEYDETSVTASSFLYPDSETVGQIETTRLQLAFEGLYGDYCITERPKMLYNEKTQKFIIVFHADGPLYNGSDLNAWVNGGCQGNCPSSRYSRAMIGFAESDTPFGPFKLVNMTRMNYDKSLDSSRLGESRDMTVFVDQGVDKNQDGVDDAYAVYSSEMNARLYVSLLNEEYTGPNAEGDKAVQGVDAAYRVLVDGGREAPAVMKYDDWYYMITSGTDGWNSTEHIYYRSQNMLEGWEKVGNPALNDTGKCFNTQVTYILPVDAENGKFIYMGDRWNANNLSDSRTIWLPLQMNSNRTISILNKTDWTIDILNEIAPVRVHTELPEVVYTDGSNLPDTLLVSYKGEMKESKVVWQKDSLRNMGNTTVIGILTDCDNVEIHCTAFVSPTNLLYFVNPSATPFSEDYNKIVELNKDTLKNMDSNDGTYLAGTGFGYTGAAGAVRNNNVDIYQSMRYPTETANSLVYQFDLKPGEYDVYIGMFDPSSWYQTNQRFADISLNGTLVTEKYAYLNNLNDTLLYTEVQPDEEGKLIVTVAPNKANKAAVQVSFIMIVGEEPELTPEPTPEPTPPIEELPYEDVEKEDWFYASVAFTYYNKLMTGMDETHFAPYGQLSRAQFALILYRMEGEVEVVTEKSFGDIAGDEWYGPAVLWAAESGIVTGYQNGNFGPADMITREQMAVMMYRYAKYLNRDVATNADYTTYKDADSVSGFATDAMKWVVGNDIITGKEGGTMLDPQGNTARAECAAIIQRFMQ